MEFFTNKFFLIAVTFISYVSAVIVQRRTGLRLLNPILISIVAFCQGEVNKKFHSGFVHF